MRALASPLTVAAARPSGAGPRGRSAAPSSRLASPAARHGRVIVSFASSRVGGGSRRALGSTSSQLAGRRIAAPQNGHQWSAVWLDNAAEVETSASLDTCWDLWQQRELIPNWMPWIDSVVVSKKDDRNSKWTLSTEQFGQKFSFSWVARNMTPVPGEKIHWAAEKGVRNRGAVRFQKTAAGATKIRMTISYEVPEVLLPFAGALTPLVEGIISEDLKRFDVYAVGVEAKA